MIKRPTKIILGGLIVAGVVWSAGALNTRRLERYEAALQATCEAESDKTKAEIARQQDRSLVNLSDEALSALAKQRGVNLSDLLAQREAQRKIVPIDDLPVPPWETDPLVCDPDELSTDTLTGVQAKIVSAHQATRASQSWPIPAALILLGIGTVPWLWYFLLRRIAELRSAIGGKPPI